MFCFPGLITGFLFHGIFHLLIFALIVGLILKAVFSDHHGGYPVPPGRGGAGGFCAHCGAQFREAAPFCPHCGARRG